MPGDFKISVTCPSCKSKIMLFSSNQDDRCPACHKSIPQLHIILNNAQTSKTSVATAQNQRSESNNISPMLDKDDCKGAIISTASKKYFVLGYKRLGGKRAYQCLRIINSESRDPACRYVHSPIPGQLISFSKESFILDDQVKSVTREFSQKQIDTLVATYNNYLSNHVPVKPVQKKKKKQKPKKLKPMKLSALPKRKSYKPYSPDGLRAGNPWQGLAMTGRSARIYRG